MRRPPRRRLATATFLSCALLASVAPVASESVSAATSFSSPRNYLRLFGETNGGGDREQIYNRTQAVAMARRYDTIVALRWTFEDHVRAMKAANPRLRLIVYMNGAMSKPGDRASMPESWFLHDANGNRIRNLRFDLRYMDIGNRGWRSWVADRCAEWIRLSGFDGCFLDDLGAGNLGVNVSAWPIDPRTGRRISEYEWISYARGLQDVVHDRNRGQLITSNGLNNGSNYFRPVHAGRILDTAHGSAAEGWLRNSFAPASEFRSVERWKDDVDMLVDAGRRGRTVLAATKLWSGESRDQLRQWRRYAYASFLLGTNGDSFLNFEYSGPGKPDRPGRLDRFNLGTPREKYTKRNGAYQRRFTRGLAIVNPGDTTVNVDLGRTYRLPSGARVTRLRMAPHSGELLRIF